MTSVLQARFLLTSGHLVATCLVIQALPLTGDEIIVAFAYLSFALSFVGLAAGADVFSPSKNAIHIACHFLGGVLLARAVRLRLPSAYLTHVLLVVHLPSTFCTLAAVGRRLLQRTSSRMQRY